MLYLYDVWVNWFEGEEKGYNVCQFYEWRKNDTIDILEQVPCLHITEALYDQIENSLAEVPVALLNKIHKKTICRIGQNREKIDYASIITDGKGVLLFDTANYRVPHKKSRLIPKQEQRVLEVIKKTKAYEFPFKQVQEGIKTNLLVLDESLVCGLTRRERQLKRLLMIALYQLKNAANYIALCYWLSEWNGSNTLQFGEGNSDHVWQLLYDELKYGWSDAHERLCEQLIKGNHLLEKYWELEMNHSQNISK